MDIAVNTADLPAGMAVVAVRGQLDLDTAAALHEALGELIGDGSDRIVLDLGGLTFCDSMGLSAVVVAHQHCAGRGGWLRLAAPLPFMLAVLSAVGLRKAVPVYADVSGACAGDPARLLPEPD